jgi:CDP-diacylglycerol---glycerol-3-phosphate 3-phosphatidyltransferase
MGVAAPTRRNVGPVMLNTSRNRALVAHVVDPVARGLLALRLTPGIVTVIGSGGAVIASMVTFPRQAWLVGTVVVAVFALSDLLDGTMARLSGSDSTWGAFLDSTLDRISDAGLSLAVLLGAIALDEPWAIGAASVSLVAGQVVPYAKARAEALGIPCDVGFAERAERVVLILLATLLAGLGLTIGFTIVLGLLAIATSATVIQRIVHVHAAIAHRRHSHGNGDAHGDAHGDTPAVD